MQIIKSVITGLNKKNWICNVTSLINNGRDCFTQTNGILLSDEDKLKDLKIGQEVELKNEGRITVTPVKFRNLEGKAEQYRRLINLESMMLQVVSCFSPQDFERYKAESRDSDEKKVFETYLSKDLNQLLKASREVILENIPTDEYGKTRLCQRENFHLNSKKEGIESGIGLALHDYDYRNSVSFALVGINEKFVEAVADYFDKGNDIIKNVEEYTTKTQEEYMERQ